MIGPFVERNGLSDGPNTGAAITWTSAGEAYRLDLIRLPSRSFWSDALGFTQAPDISFEEFLWRCFEHTSSRLPAFLNELLPFIRPSGGAPSPAEAGQWLNPALVAQGFSLGIAKLLKDGKVRIPVLWVFGGNVSAYGSRPQYSRIDFIDWTSTEARLLRAYHCWGHGARALRRLLHQLVDGLNGSLLTEAGEARMRQLVSRSRPQPAPAKPIPFTQTEKTTATRLRQSLYDLPDPLTPEFQQLVTKLPEKAYTGLLRSCVRRGLPRSAKILLLHRPLPAIGRLKLLEQFIDAKWTEIWSVCAKEASPELTAARYGYNALLHRVVETGDLPLLQSVLGCLVGITSPVAQYLLELTFRHNRMDMFDAVLAARVVQPVRSVCMLKCFSDCLYDHRQGQPLALHLLELGVRPIQNGNPNDIFSPYHRLIENHNLPVLKRVLELEPPTPESLASLLNGHLRPGVSFDFLCSLSRQFPGHKSRMDQVASRMATSFIYGGDQQAITVLDLALSEGASLQQLPHPLFADRKPLAGYGWKKREGNWIDLIGHLLKTGHAADAEILKKLKRPRERAS